MSCFLGPFSPRNNLFYFGLNFIYRKWKFFKYSTFFGICFSKNPVFEIHLTPVALKFEKNLTVSEFNEIRLGDKISRDDFNGKVHFVIRDLKKLQVLACPIQIKLITIFPFLAKFKILAFSQILHFTFS